jgi:hypothetical protein
MVVEILQLKSTRCQQESARLCRTTRNSERSSSIENSHVPCSLSKRLSATTSTSLHNRSNNNIIERDGAQTTTRSKAFLEATIKKEGSHGDHRITLPDIVYPIFVALHL